MSLSVEGMMNLNEVLERIGFNSKVDAVFIVKHYEQIAKEWPAEDDVDYRKDHPGRKPAWWTFDAECNGGGIGDTCQREQLADVISNILIGESWPCNGDGPSDEFFEKMKPYLKE